MGFWGWVGAIAAGWFTASIVLAIGWGLAGYRLRKPRIVRKDGKPMSQREVDAVFAVMTLDLELRGIGGEQ